MRVGVLYFACLSMTIAACGGADEAACPMGACEDSQCEDSCPRGAATCIGDERAECVVDADGCARWSEPSACEVELICSGAGECIADTSVEFTDYWILGQLPDQTTMFLYARDAVTIEVSGTVDEPVTLELVADTFASYELSELGFTQQDSEWFFLQLHSTGNVMLNFDRVVTLRTDENVFSDVHGDSLHDRPPRDLGTEHYFPFAGSGTVDDVYVMYAPDETTVTVSALANDGSRFSQDITFSGIYVSETLAQEFGIGLVGFGAHFQGNRPFAVGVFDELPQYPNPNHGSDYYFGRGPDNVLYDEYMFIDDRSDGYSSLYLPTANRLAFRDGSGAAVGTREIAAETSTMIPHTEVGYGPFAEPSLVHILGDESFAESFATPVATDLRDSASYMGWNASMAELQIYSAEETEVKIYDGRDRQKLAELDVQAGGIRIERLTDLGFAADEPFLLVVMASRAIYQQVKIPYYLRQYPGYAGPVID